MLLTDEQCNEFRRLPCPFNDMVRAIHSAGIRYMRDEALELCHLTATDGMTIDELAAEIMRYGK